MERLWSPWRMQYIDDVMSGKGDGCFLCRALGGEDSKELILSRGEHVFVIMNRYPYNSGHLMVVPNNHIAELSQMNEYEMEQMMKFMAISVDVLKGVLLADGINCGVNLGKCAGAGLRDHVHFHVVPRWVGDTNFMPVLGNTKSLPEYLEATYSKLKPAFDKFFRIGGIK